jgi:hypothetical protein
MTRPGSPAICAGSRGRSSCRARLASVRAARSRRVPDRPAHDPQTDDAITVVLARRTERRSRSGGQFLTFQLSIDGELVSVHSLSSSPLDGLTASITVKRVAGGRVRLAARACARARRSRRSAVRELRRAERARGPRSS